MVTLKEKLSADDYKTLNGKVKAVGGYYSRFAKTPDGKAIPGFIFKAEPTGKELSVFNDFFEETAVGERHQSESSDDTYSDVKAESKKDITDTQIKTEESLIKEPKSDIIEVNIEKDGAENVESQFGILDREGKPDGRRLHAGADGLDVETRTEEADEPYRNSSGKGLSKSTGTDRNRPDVRNDSEGVHRTDDADNAVPEIRGNSAEITDNTPEIIETGVKTVEKKRQSNKGNFLITNDIAAEIDNTSPSAKDNIEAIELLLTLENEGRFATAEEKKALVKYKGWGGIDARNITYELSSRFGKLFGWEQRKAMQSSQNNAFFTPTKVIDAMYTGLKRMGFKGGNVLEPIIA